MIGRASLGIVEYRQFDTSEYRERLSKAQKIMKARDIDALFITEGSNYYYFTGGESSISYTRPQLVVIPESGEPVAILQEFVLEAQKRQLWFSDIEPYQALLGVPFNAVKNVFARLGIEKRTIGCELGYEQRLNISYNDFARLRKELPNARFVDASDALWSIRMKKTNSEVECLRRACKTTSEAYEYLFQHTKAGMTENEVLTIFNNFQSERGYRAWSLINSGPYNYDVISSGPSGRRLENGNFLWIDGGCSVKGYWSDFTRMASIGKATERQKKMYQISRELTTRIVEEIKPGLRCSALDRVCQSQLQNLGLEMTFKSGRIGHGLGLITTEPPHIASYDQTILEPGMVITIEPGFIADCGCFQFEQNVLVTINGHEILSVASSDLNQIN